MRPMKQQRFVAFFVTVLAVSLQTSKLPFSNAAALPLVHSRDGLSGRLLDKRQYFDHPLRNMQEHKQAILQLSPSSKLSYIPYSVETASTSSDSAKSASRNNKTCSTSKATVSSTSRSTPTRSSSSSSQLTSTSKATTSTMTSLSTPSASSMTTASSSTVSGAQTASARAAAAYATVTTSAKTKLVLQTNNASYSYDQVMNDLESLMKWAYDQNNLTSDEKVEVVAALMSAAARYYPELPTDYIIRIMLADIQAESDFKPRIVGDPRLDSGSSYGLLQISPNAGSQELPTFVAHANVDTHNFTWGIDAPQVRAGVRGPLIDWATGKTIDKKGLVVKDLFRPWINIHLAMWTQSNLARTSSSDPWLWQEINEYSAILKASTASNLGTSLVSRSTSKQQSAYDKLLVGADAPLTAKTALGSWVAGPATNGDGSYLSKEDDISSSYFKRIIKALNHLYGVSDLKSGFLNRYSVFSGLVDYVS